MRIFLAPLLLALATTGCGLVYKVDVYQGNLLEPEAVEQLEPGMTKRQVALLIGSPSVQDPFHQQRWDYISSMARDGDDPDIKNLTLHFEGDVLARVEGDYFPEMDATLEPELRGRYGNIPRDKDDRRRRR